MFWAKKSPLPEYTMLFGCKFSLEIVSTKVSVRWSERLPSGEVVNFEIPIVVEVLGIGALITVVTVIAVGVVLTSLTQLENRATRTAHAIGRFMTLQRVLLDPRLNRATV